jgi:DNA repair protein RecO (recombination protein O)
VFLHKSSDALDLLTEAKLERRFRLTTRDLSCLYAGYYVAELLRDLTDTGDPHPELFDAADQALVALEGSTDVFRVVLRFEMTALRLLGHSPALHGCASCGQPIEVSGRVPFGQVAGGLLCPHCRPGQRQVVSVTAGAVRVLQQFAAGDSDTWREVEVDAKIRGELRGLMNQYLCNLLDHRPRMHPYLGLLGHLPE